LAPHRPERTIRLIAAFKLFKGALLLLVGIGALSLMHREASTLFSRAIETLHLNADSRVIHAALLKVDGLTPVHFELAGVTSLGYSALLMTEGVGLWLRKRWAAYLAVISMALLLPFEIYELIQRVTAVRIGALIANIAIVGYLIWHLKTEKRALH
jgi:uncharacterized membrane protein (DUF2068 family)